MFKKLVIFSITIIITSVFSSCRPKDLEGAFVHYNQNRIDQAFPLAKRSTQMYPENSEAWYLLGVIYSKKDSVEQMVNAFNKSLKIENTYKNQIEAEKMQLYAKKYNTGAAKFNAYMSNEDRKSAEAITDIELSIRSFQESYLLSPTFQAVNLASQGLLLLGKNDEAKKVLIGLTEDYPDTSSSWVALGKYYFAEEDYNNAKEHFQKATEMNPNSIEAFILLAQAYDFMDDYINAEVSYSKAISLDSTDSAVLFNLGLLHYKIASLKELTSEEKNQRYSLAVDNFGKSIKLNPDFINSYQLKGNAELLLRRFEDAKNTLEQGIGRYPNDKQMWDDLSICYANLGNKIKAEEAAARAGQL